MSCSTIYRNHGYTPPEDELSNIIVGIDTRASVEDALGVPTTGGVSNSDGMYYVSSRWRHFGAMAPKPVSREIVGVTFDANGVVQNISRYGLEDGEVVVLELSSYQTDLARALTPDIAVFTNLSPDHLDRHH
ncbi:MAG: Mur ligase family protein, partial [Planktomarina sp.]